MKNSRVRLLVILATGAVTALLINASPGQGQLPSASAKVAVCDVAQVFDNYIRSKDLSAEFAGRGETLKAEDAQRLRAIENLQSELAGLMVGSEEYERRLNEAHRLSIDRKAWMEFQSQLAERDRLRLTKEMYDEVIATVDVIAKQRGIEIVIYRKGQEEPAESMAQLLQQVELRKVIYASDKADITDAVLLSLNEAYRAGKK